MITIVRRVLVGAIVIGVGFAGVGHEVSAQDVRVDVVIPSIVIRDIQRIVDRAIGQIDQAVARDVTRDISRDIGREIGRAMRDSIPDLSWVGRLPAAVVYDQARQDREFPVVAPVDRTTKTLQIGTDGSLDLRNVIGDITVTAGTGRTATVEIARESRGRTEADAKEGLQKVTVEVVERTSGASIEVKQPSEDKPPYRVSVSYTVTAPPGTRLSITTIAGKVATKGIKGDLNVDVVSGSLDISDAGRITSAKTISGPVTISNTRTEAGIEASSVSGAVTFTGVKAHRLSGNVVSGDVIARDSQADEVNLHSMTNNVDWTGPLAARSRYELQSFAGTVRFAVTGPVGFDLSAETYTGQIRVEQGIELRTTTTSRRQTRGTVGDGGATVYLHTFSGNVIVTKR